MATRASIHRRFLVAAGAVLAFFFQSRPARCDESVTYDFRQQVTAVLMPSHDYAVTGQCATGTGSAAASIYANGGSGRGSGVGIGVGMRFGYHYVPNPPTQPRATWWAFRAGTGLDLGFLYAKVDTGITDVSGQLCARVKSDGAQVQYKGSSVLLAQALVFAGGELGITTGGKEGDERGIVLGAAWSPALTYLQPWATSGDVNASFLGLELTLDFVTLREVSTPHADKRVAVFILLPIQDKGPAILTLSFGAVWF
jgi:hypothetical protein